MQRAALILTVGLMSGPALADSFTASNGAVLPAPALETLSCDELDQLMVSYANSHYRNATIPHRDHPDRPIYEYEHRLAQMHYQDCQMGQIHFENSATAFSRGWN